MTRAKRPKLGAVLRGGEGTPVAAPSQIEQAPEQATVAAEKMVQLNVAVPEELRRDLRIRALQQGVDVSTIVRQLLKEWLKDT
jgi:predicted HicB family RNase H-like nuclease